MVAQAPVPSSRRRIQAPGGSEEHSMTVPFYPDLAMFCSRVGVHQKLDHGQ